ncbi:MAG: hypothetical protein RIM72_01425 [Alphaproteobacteria bacterium]
MPDDKPSKDDYGRAFDAIERPAYVPTSKIVTWTFFGCFMAPMAVFAFADMYVDRKIIGICIALWTVCASIGVFDQKSKRKGYVERVEQRARQYRDERSIMSTTERSCNEG